MTAKKPFFRQSNVRGGLAIGAFGFVVFPAIPVALQVVWGDAVAKAWVTATTIGATTVAGQTLPQITTGTLIGVIGAVWLLWPKLVEGYRAWKGGPAQ